MNPNRLVHRKEYLLRCGLPAKCRGPWKNKPGRFFLTVQGVTFEYRPDGTIIHSNTKIRVGAGKLTKADMAVDWVGSKRAWAALKEDA